ncbi:N-acetyltransferase family protein [Halorubrum sp. DTA98]|uniref:GNAT family N-acetyltransferase n=1 Tax=Halorubrum sp. DTA98 TaxID=3402163 RepID=UPI003AAEF776
MSDSARAACDGWNSSACVGTEHCPPRCPRFVDKHGSRWTLRPTREGDAERLAEMYEAFGIQDRAQGVPPTVDQRRRSWVDTLLSEGENVVAADRDRLVGHVVYTPSDGDRPELAVFVHPSFQERGIGTELCKHAIAAAADADREALELHVESSNRAALSVYRRLGFTVVDRDGDVRMTLPLDEAIATTARMPPAERMPTPK